ncbi:hypothetical protein GOBAR_AA06975 [Gossypium barbadense]|uniref:Uncharacterized protein n=1 Tax=Gossypium barbadense TaxID=3634 RepID=A0A2P5YDE4_GOSBA|nr:hypothetical protein GOBAR_AA06975 [Gossypium barbadense]
MELVDDENMETMVALYCWDQSRQNDLIQLLAEFIDVEPAEDSTPLGEERGVQDPCTVVPRVYIDRRSTLCGIGIDFNAPPTSENLNLGSCLQIHPVVIETDADGDDVYDNNGSFDHEIEEYSDLDLDEVLDDINNESANDDRNVNASSIRNPNRGIMICNDPRVHMSIMDPNAMHASKFSEYPDILLAHRLAVDSEREKLFMG